MSAIQGGKGEDRYVRRATRGWQRDKIDTRRATQEGPDEGDDARIRARVGKKDCKGGSQVYKREL